MCILKVIFCSIRAQIFISDTDSKSAVNARLVVIDNDGHMSSHCYSLWY
jgi:hypothetical protein